MPGIFCSLEVDPRLGHSSGSSCCGCHSPSVGWTPVISVPIIFPSADHKGLFTFVFFLLLLSLPKVVKRRVNALKNLQVKCAHIEAKFYEEVHELERKYAALYQPLFDKVSVPDSWGGVKGLPALSPWIYHFSPCSMVKGADQVMRVLSPHFWIGWLPLLL